MTKIITLITASAFFATSYSTPTNGAEFPSRITSKVCTYTYAGKMYFAIDIDSTRSCPNPPDPEVYVNGGDTNSAHFESVEVFYTHSIGNTDYFRGVTSDGEGCVVDARTLLIAD